MSQVQVADRSETAPVTAGQLDRLARAIVVVSASAEDVPHATTIDSFTFVSADPVLALVSLTRGSTMLDLISRAGTFAVSVLASDQEPLARRFASRNRGIGDAQFIGVTHSKGLQTRAPLLHGALAWFEFEACQPIVVGDHVMVLGSLLQALCGRDDRPALLRQDRSYCHTSLV